MPPSSETPDITTETSKSDILDLLNDDSEAPPETLDLEDKKIPPTDRKTSDEEETTTEEPEKETKKEEIKLVSETETDEEPQLDEDKLDLIAPARRQEILKKYPTLFKDFPHLEKAYYRDQQYNEMFSTPEDAKQVIDVANAYYQYSEKIAKGDTSAILKTVKDQDPKAYGKLVDNYLMTLKSVDEGAFFHVVGNTIKSTVAAMANTAQQNNDEELLGAARILYKFVNGTTDYTPPKPFSKPDNPQETEEVNRLTRDRLEFFQQQLDTVQTDLQGRVDGVLKNTIDQNMDPRGSMTPYVKRVAVSEAMTNVQKSIDADPQFRRVLDRLWEKAAEERFSKVSIEKIRSAYLSKAKTLLPEQIKKSRNEALRGLGKRVREDTSDSNDDNTGQKRATAPKTLRSSNTGANPSAGKRTIDYFNED